MLIIQAWVLSSLRELFYGAGWFTMPMSVIMVRNVSFLLAEESQPRGSFFCTTALGEGVEREMRRERER